MSPQPAKNLRPIIVIGPERSGTSVVAEMICRWGAYPGEPGKQREADKRNPRGYFEYLPIWDFLGELGTNWWDEDFQVEVKEKASVPEHRRKATEMIVEMEKAGRPWVWKDPALSFFLPFWKQIWISPIYVVTVRDPLDVALSWHEFTGPSGDQDSSTSISRNLLRWHYIMSTILVNIEDNPSKIFVPFEDLLNDPEKVARRLGTFLEIECGDGEPNRQTFSDMAAAVHPTLCRNANPTPFDEVPSASPELKELYRFAVAKIENPLEPFQSSDYPMHQGWRDCVTA